MTLTAPVSPQVREGRGNRRQQTLWIIGLCLFFLVAVILSTWFLGDTGLNPVLAQRNQPPSLAHPFGTDWLGRDMLTRSLHGMSLSLRIGLLAATLSALIAALLGLAAGTLGGWVDGLITWVVDVCLSLPHLVLLILIAFAAGGGTRGVIIAVALTHWPSLARVIRAEVLQVNSSDYVQLSHRLGRSPAWIARHHMVPHIMPQLLVGLILLFPHAILHEAALSFIGIGLSPHLPAIGIILAESMRHLSTGYWWLGVLPGLLLLLSVKAFDWLGENLRTLLDPKTSQE
ncbi:ABC transporter permease [Pseudanabaena sp. FACHB-2040]|uniref:ABC transporter permease n=1 Tax=Pseudanabaena sp. FACHB-2040 TaxID=2692859 RepID=UPI0016877728|nr:ABC transporter permease [Pseudanabaena sp. FACHB-2040]MBD0267323.1 ABC transporter permease [Cyanobacteria bacterium Co-bin8]MBD2256887.1 ABC transporter permease [Pseudanabaena sp. FACHB-2040]